MELPLAPRSTRRTLRLEKGEVLRLLGPLRLRVTSGCVVAAGVEACEGFEAVVQAERGASLYALESSAEVELILGHGAGAEVLRDEEAVRVAREWLEVARTAPRGKVLVLGPVESGKSTLTLWLLNSQSEACYASLDAGQNELGTPGYFSLAHRGEAPALHPLDLNPVSAWLVGCNAPEHCHWPAVSAAARLASYAAKTCTVTLMDTDGFVAGPGLVYKASIIEATQPDTIIVVEKGPWRQLAATASMYAEVLRAPAAPQRLVRSRDRGERRAYRARMYQRLFANPEKIEIDTTSVPVHPLEPGHRPPERLIASITHPDGSETPALTVGTDRLGTRLYLLAAWRRGTETKGVKLGFTRLTRDWREERLLLRPH